MSIFTSVAAVFPPEEFGVRLGASRTAQIPIQTLFPLTSSVPALGSLTATILTYDYAVLSAGFSAPANLTLSVQPYLDDEALIANGAPVSVTGTTGVATTPTGLIFRSATVTVSNAGASPVVLGNLSVVVRSIN